jgi:hypothetical protein
MADFCGVGKSMTKNGTLVDIYDYSANTQMGFIPKTRGFVLSNWNTATAFVNESHFDTVGAYYIDHGRYDELQTNPAWNINQTCPGLFWESSEFFPYNRNTPAAPPFVLVDSTPACAHSEFTIGKWLHRECSRCSDNVPAYCNDATDPRGWDQGCVDAVKASSMCVNQTTGAAYTDEVMSTHSECSVGTGLKPYDTGCTLQVCLSNPSCCNLGLTAWSQSCVNTANAQCKGGREGLMRGFCGTSLIVSPTGGSTF